MDRFTGSCQCGNVRFVATGKPWRVGICHCLDCRKHHGALFSASAIFPEDAVTVEGELHEYKGRHFCPACGSSVFARTDDEVEILWARSMRPTSSCRPTRVGPCAVSRGCRHSRYGSTTSATARHRAGSSRCPQPCVLLLAVPRRHC